MWIDSLVHPYTALCPEIYAWLHQYVTHSLYRVSITFFQQLVTTNRWLVVNHYLNCSTSTSVYFNDDTGILKYEAALLAIVFRSTVPFIISFSNSSLSLKSRSVKEEWRFSILVATSPFELSSITVELVDDDDCV